MAEVHYRWTANGVRKHLCVRYWWNANPIRAAVKWILGLTPWYSKYNPPADLSIESIRGQGECYCPTGSSTNFRVQFFTAGFWGWLSRDWTIRPCVCDEVISQFAGDDA